MMFAKATKAFVKEVDCGGDLISVSSLNNLDKLQFLNLVTKKKKTWCWQNPKYHLSSVSLNDLLSEDMHEPIKPVIVESDFVKYEGKFEDCIRGSIDTSLGRINLGTGASDVVESLSSFGNLKKQEIDLRKLMKDVKGRSINLQTSLLEQMLERKNDVLCILIEKILTTQKCLISEHIQKEEKLAGMVGISTKIIKVSVKENGNMIKNSNVVLEIPAPTTIAYGVIELYIKRDGQFDLPGVAPTEETSIPLLLIDTADCGLFELEVEEEQSRGNPGEVQLTGLHIDALIEAGVKAKDVAVIAPYNLQVDMLRKHLYQKYPELEIKSVDGFQGREKEAVVLSFVRSNRKGEVGFLAEDRRINVAITRARRHVAVICDSRTVSNHNFLKRLVEYMSIHGEVRTAFEYLDDIVPGNYTPKSPRDQEKRLKCSIDPLPKTLGDKPKRRPTQKPRERLAECSLESRGKVTTSETKENENSFKHKARILEFLESGEVQLDFPSSLNAHDRMLIHQLAEEYGLQHVSTGEGSARHISICRRDSPAELSLGDHVVCQPELIQGSPKEVDAGGEERERGAGPGATDLKTLHVERMERERAKKEERVKQSRESNVNLQEIIGKKDKNVGGKASSKSKKEIAAEEDFDAMISAAMKADNTCGFSKCKASVTTLGQLCQHCNRRYCLSHHIPEVHGCGEKAKANARQRISKEGILYPGSGVKDKSLDPTKRAHLQRRLDQKLSELSKQRKSKRKDREK